MARLPKIWTLDTYTVDTMTDIAVIGADGAIVKSIIVTNTSGATATVDLIISDNVDTKLFTILPGAILEPGAVYKFPIEALPLSPSTKIRGSVDIAGVEFLVSGAE